MRAGGNSYVASYKKLEKVISIKKQAWLPLMNVL